MASSDSEEALIGMDSLEQMLSNRRRSRGLRCTKGVIISTVVVLLLAGMSICNRSSWRSRKPSVQDQSSVLTVLAEKLNGSCAHYHCGVFNPVNKCQCNAACMDFDSCCLDYKPVCVDKSYKKQKPRKPKKVDMDPDMMWQSSLMRAVMKQQMALASGEEHARHEQEEHLEAAEKAMLARLKALETSEEDSQMPTEQEIKQARKKEKEKKAKVVSNRTGWHGIARSSFLDSLADLLSSSSREDQKLKKSAEKVVLAREKKEKEKLKDEKTREEKEKEAAKEKRKQFQEAISQWRKDEKIVPNVTLYCFSLMMPFGYEPNLVWEQKKRSVGIYACNEHMVFSNVSTLMNGQPSPVSVHIIEGTLAVAYGGRWMTALNTGVFNRLWMEVIRLQRYRFHDWSVKVDSDAVFFADRLRQLLRHKRPYSEIPHVDNEPREFGNCRTCKLESHSHDSCASHVRWWQQKGHTCPEALKLTAREPPLDCGCDCDDFACDLPDAAVYLNNCKWGLHGPIEVLSRRAVATFAAGLPRCVSLLAHPWGEDKFLDQCLQLLGVNRDNEYSLLSETACGDQPAPCGTSNVAFHPFKSIQSYFTCHAYAAKYGNGPAVKPTFEEFSQERGTNLDGDDDDEH